MSKVLSRWCRVTVLTVWVLGLLGCKRKSSEPTPSQHGPATSRPAALSSTNNKVARLRGAKTHSLAVRSPWLQTFSFAAPHPQRYRLLKLPKRLPVPKSEQPLSKQPKDWRLRMKRAGQAFRAHGVKAIVLVHGTFVGSDPVGAVAWLKSMFPSIPSNVLRTLQKWIDKTQDVLTRDLGDFLPEYVTLLKQGLGGIPCYRFRWSSENHHAARAKAALDLIDFLVDVAPKGPLSPRQRLLLVGHSHAGQVFALLLHLLASSKEVPLFLKAMEVPSTRQKILRKKLQRLRTLSLDVLTMGTPPRYTWMLPPQGRVRLLHLINHRGKKPRAGRFSGVLSTRDGDYVQQWGIAGSDLLGSTRSKLRRNKALVPLLGPSASPLHWNRARKYRTRLHSVGLNLLVDYRDTFKLLRPKEWFTLFGHGIYTRYKTLLFWVETVQQRWYR